MMHLRNHIALLHLLSIQKGLAFKHSLLLYFDWLDKLLRPLLCLPVYLWVGCLVTPRCVCVCVCACVCALRAFLLTALLFGCHSERRPAHGLSLLSMFCGPMSCFASYCALWPLGCWCWVNLHSVLCAEVVLLLVSAFFTLCASADQ